MDLDLIFTLIFFAGIGFFIFFIYKMFRRISSIEDFPTDYVGMMLTGIVTSVPDGDGFSFFHTPWFRSESYSRSDRKLPIRLTGIDAPEMRGNIPGQPFAEESKRYLNKLIWKKKVDIRIVGTDQYNRVLAFAYLRHISFIPGWRFGVNINFQMIKEGLACVYTGRDAKYDGNQEKLMELEETAKRKRLGMWKFNNTVTPMQHKRNHRNAQNCGVQFGYNSSNVLDQLRKSIFG